MIGRTVLCLALISCASVASAQDPACSLYRVNTSLLNVSKGAGDGIYIDMLEHDDIACVTRRQTAAGKEWGFIVYKLEKPDKRTPVNGWSTLRYMKELSPAETAAAAGGTPPPAAPAPAAAAKPAPVAAPPAAAAKPAPVATLSVAAAPPAAAVKPPATPARAPANADSEDVLHFNQPVPFGPFPINGRTLKEMAESTPLFPPIEDLPEALWKDKQCTTCHKWNQARLCDQGKFYAKAAKNVLRHQHPFGGTYKIALMRWAKSGCN